MKIKSFDFTLRELAGSMGDYGTLFPLAIGYIAICGLNPAGFLVMMGLTNIIIGHVYKLPVPLQPMKVLAVVAIAQQWSPSMVYASGFAMGVIWLLFTVTGIMNLIARVTPHSVIRGIQVSIGVLLAITAFKMVSTCWSIGVVSLIVALVLRKNHLAPSAIMLMFLGVAIVVIKGKINEVDYPSLNLPPLTGFSLKEVWQTLLLAGFAQIPLTATNAVLATSSLIKTYWPEKPVSERQLSFNMGIINVIIPFFGGMPMCHGAGGLAGQHYFGARTGGAKIIEGLIEISLGVFFASSIARLFSIFPEAIIGAMMLLVGMELIKFAKDVDLNKDLIPLGATVVISLATTMAYGFLGGLIAYYSIQFIFKKKKSLTILFKLVDGK
jgi:xanthine/uracil/vitamin C permease (AzgA family)